MADVLSNTNIWNLFASNSLNGDWQMFDTGTSDLTCDLLRTAGFNPRKNGS